MHCLPVRRGVAVHPSFAKDEQDNIEPCVRTMAGQDYPNFELLVCNDRSDDETGPIVQRIADEDPRVKLLNIEHLPDGWCGKNNAMQTGMLNLAALVEPSAAPWPVSWEAMV